MLAGISRRWAVSRACACVQVELLIHRGVYVEASVGSRLASQSTVRHFTLKPVLCEELAPASNDVRRVTEFGPKVGNLESDCGEWLAWLAGCQAAGVGVRR